MFKKIGAVGALVLVSAQSAFAALPEAATTGISEAGADLAEAGGLVIAAMIAFWGLQKLGRKMGWF